MAKSHGIPKPDKRTFERKLANGSIVEKEWKTYLESLADESANCETVSIWENEKTLPSEKLRRRRPAENTVVQMESTAAIEAPVAESEGGQEALPPLPSIPPESL